MSKDEKERTALSLVIETITSSGSKFLIIVVVLLIVFISSIMMTIDSVNDDIAKYKQVTKQGIDKKIDRILIPNVNSIIIKDPSGIYNSNNIQMLKKSKVMVYSSKNQYADDMSIGNTNVLVVIIPE